MPNSKSNTASAALPRTRRVLLLPGLLLVAVTIGNCSNASTPANQPGTGGAPSSGGASATGGATSAGGTTSTGGAPATGGTVAAGGLATTGGVTASGGNVGTGGSTKNDASPPGTGGAGTGGVTANGGSSQAGGTLSTGGATSTDAGTGNQDVGPGSGGVPKSGGSTGTGGTIAGGSATGGTARTGGTTGSGGSGGGTNLPNCTAVPVVPGATQQTRNALCYLYQIYGNHILSSQEENNDDNAMNYIVQNTGKKPAMRAFDVNNTQAPTQCVAHAKQGGLCMFGYHMGIANGDGYASSQTKTDINTVLTEGSAYNTTFKARLDKTAAMIQTAQDGGAVAIMRLFHEAGGKWFWWSMETGAQYVRLYQYAFNYLTVTKGLKNMLWMLPYDGNPDKSFYPGKAYVDIGGADVYAGDGNYAPQTAMYNNCVSVFGSTMPIALHECGPIPDPAQLQSAGAKWVLFSVWTSPYYQSPSNSVAHLQAVYTSDYVITLDKMPGF
jgi:hypothetical protein